MNKPSFAFQVAHCHQFIQIRSAFFFSCKPPENAWVQRPGLSQSSGSPSLHILYHLVNPDQSPAEPTWKMWAQHGLICLPINPTRTNLQCLSTQRPTTLLYPNKTARGLRRTEDSLWHRYKESMFLLTKRSVWHHLAAVQLVAVIASAIIAIYLSIHFEIQGF